MPAGQRVSAFSFLIALRPTGQKPKLWRSATRSQQGLLAVLWGRRAGDPSRRASCSCWPHLQNAMICQCTSWQDQQTVLIATQAATPLMQLGCRLYYIKIAVQHFCCPPVEAVAAPLRWLGTLPSVLLLVDCAGGGPTYVQGGLLVPRAKRTPCFTSCWQWRWQQFQLAV